MTDASDLDPEWPRRHPAADTALSHVDGAAGELIIAGERVGHLAATSSFEGVDGAALDCRRRGKPISEAEVRAVLGDARERAFQRLAAFWFTPREGLSIVDGCPRRDRSTSRRARHVAMRRRSSARSR